MARLRRLMPILTRHVPQGEVSQLGAKPTERLSWSQTDRAPQLESNRPSASAGAKPIERLSWSQTDRVPQQESKLEPIERLSWSQTDRAPQQ